MIVEKKKIRYTLNLISNKSSMANLSESKKKAENTKDHHVENGKLCLLRGDHQGMSYLKDENEPLPDDPEQLLKKATHLSSYGKQKKVRKYLLLANKYFKKAAKLSPEEGEIFQGWGQSLFILGEITNSAHFYIEGEKQYRKAHSLYQKAQKTPPSFSLEFARIMMKIAYHSSEACDFNVAYKIFSSAEHLNQEKAFWLDFGTTCTELYQRSNNIDLLEKAIQCYKTAISNYAYNANDWFQMAMSLSTLYNTNRDADTLQKANDCFATATKLNPLDAAMWIKWAILLKEDAVYTKKEKKFHAALEKCRKARFISPNSKECTIVWAETLALMGEHTSDLSLLHEAKNKILALEAQSHIDPEVLYTHGLCLTSYAHYYQDIDYYYQAAEKFQEALSKNSSSAKYWHAIGKVHAEAYAIDKDPITIERGIRFCEKALHLSCQPEHYLSYAHLLSLKGEHDENESLLEQASHFFEQGFHFVSKKYFLESKWHLKYAQTLDLLGDIRNDDSYYFKALNVLIDAPVNNTDIWAWHYQVGITYAHIGEIEDSEKYLLIANDHFKLAYDHNEDADSILIDWGLNFINLSELTVLEENGQTNTYLKQAEYKMQQALKLGNKQAFYYLSCISSLLKDEIASVAYLKKSHHFSALPATNVLLNDSWLDYVKHTDYFSQFMNCLEEV